MIVCSVDYPLDFESSRINSADAPADTLLDVRIHKHSLRMGTSSKMATTAKKLQPSVASQLDH